MRAPENAWRRHCPVCPEGDFPLPMWEWKRRRERRCPNCDTQIEFVVPALPYYAFNAGVQIVSALAAPAVLFVFFVVAPRAALLFIVALFALLLGLTLLSNYLFGRWAVLRRADETPAREQIYRRRFGD
jgi:transposase